MIEVSCMERLSRLCLLWAAVSVRDTSIGHSLQILSTKSSRVFLFHDFGLEIGEKVDNSMRVGIARPFD